MPAAYGYHCSPKLPPGFFLGLEAFFHVAAAGVVGFEHAAQASSLWRKIRDKKRYLHLSERPSDDAYSAKIHIAPSLTITENRSVRFGVRMLLTKLETIPLHLGINKSVHSEINLIDLFIILPFGIRTR